ncbi:MAG: hypothetical protein KDA91_01500 [Planctomycetaceae bacterium]|nr:hypothetical protein [Planctomycetaceae bacterium]
MKRIRVNLNRSPTSVRYQGRIVGLSDMAAAARFSNPGAGQSGARPRTAGAPANGRGGTAAAEESVPDAAPQFTPEQKEKQAAKARADKMRQLHELMTTVAESVTELQEQQRQSLDELQHVAVELAVVAASWLTGVAIDAGQFAVDDIIRLALKRMEADTPVRVCLHPLDSALLNELLNEPENKDLQSQFTCAEDSGLKRGSCRIESGRKLLVSDMESRLEEIRRLWMENLDESQIERRGDGSHGRALRRFPDRRETA